MPQFQPSSEVCSTASALGSTPASARMSASRTPLHQALPTSVPPTGFDTQLSVVQASVTSRSIRSAYVSTISWSTRPWMRSFHSLGSMAGIAIAVWIR